MNNTIMMGVIKMIFHSRHTIRNIISSTSHYILAKNKECVIDLVDGISILCIRMKKDFMEESMYSICGSTDSIAELFPQVQSYCSRYTIVVNLNTMNTVWFLKFIIAHELSHILNEDLSSDARIEEVNKLRMSSYYEPDIEIYADIGAIRILGIDLNMYKKIIKKTYYWNIAKKYGSSINILKRIYMNFKCGNDRYKRTISNIATSQGNTVDYYMYKMDLISQENSINRLQQRNQIPELTKNFI